MVLSHHSLPALNRVSSIGLIKKLTMLQCPLLLSADAAKGLLRERYRRLIYIYAYPVHPTTPPFTRVSKACFGSFTAETYRALF